MSAETPSVYDVPDGFWDELQARHNVLFDEADTVHRGRQQTAEWTWPAKSAEVGEEQTAFLVQWQGRHKRALGGYALRGGLQCLSIDTADERLHSEEPLPGVDYLYGYKLPSKHWGSREPHIVMAKVAVNNVKDPGSRLEARRNAERSRNLIKRGLFSPSADECDELIRLMSLGIVSEQRI